jgi:hypothetical protein
VPCPRPSPWPARFLGAGLDALAFGLERVEGGDVEVEAAVGEAFRDGVDVGAEQLDV